MAWARETPVAAVARLVGEHGTRLWRILDNITLNGNAHLNILERIMEV